MNTPTLVASLIMAALLALLIAFLIRQMMRGWLHRAQRQAELIGTLPPLPDTVGPAIVAATKGLMWAARWYRTGTTRWPRVTWASGPRP